MNLEQGRIISDRYEIVEKIGVGGMANVYRAKDLKLERFVTFKVLKEEYAKDEDFIKRFSVEAQAAARLSHPNIVTVYDVGNEGSVNYIVMEFIDGYTLKELIKRKAPFANDEALGVAIQIASALENAHENGIVHRDIKPQNILVTKDGSIKVTDFGIARAVNSNTITTESMGSVHYFSPEQARGVYVDNKSDIYSLGIVLYEMVTGKLPFDGDSPVQLAMKHINDPLPDMRQYNDGISTSIEKIILKATQKVSTQRYQSAEELNNDLKRALTNETGDFVKKQDFADDDSPTVVITKADRDAINNEIKNNNAAGLENAAENYNAYDSEEGYEYGEEEFEGDDAYDSSDSEYEDDDYEEMPALKNKPDYNDDDAYYRAKEKKVVIAAIITALVIIIAITVVGVWLLKKNQAPETTVPDFVGMSFSDAENLGKQNRFYVNITGQEYSEYDENVIISQDPAEGTVIKEGEGVNVVISSGKDPSTVTYTVPNFIGKSIDEANEEIKTKNMDITLDYEWGDEEEYPEKQIYEQDREPGTVIKMGEKITVTLSRGAKKASTTVPDCKGKTSQEAQRLIKEANLEVSVQNVESTEYEKGYVTSQVPAAGRSAVEGTTVTILVSSGKVEKETPVKDDTDDNPIIDNSKNNTSTENDNNNNNNENENGGNSTDENTSEASSGNESSSEETTKYVTVTLDPELPADSETVDVKFIEVGGSQVIQKNGVSVDSFPLTVTVSGNRPKNFQLYIDGKLISDQSIDFDE